MSTKPDIHAILNPEPPRFIEDFVIGQSVYSMVEDENGITIRQSGGKIALEVIRPIVDTFPQAVLIDNLYSGDLEQHDGRWWFKHKSGGLYPTGEDDLIAAVTYLIRSVALGRDIAKAA